GAAIGEVLHGVADGPRRQVFERGQADHDGVSLKGRTAIASAGAPNADSTTSGCLKVKSGTRSGPTRAAFPLRLSPGRTPVTSSTRMTSSACKRTESILDVRSRQVIDGCALKV